MTILPKIPSKLLRIAHADLEKSRDDPNCTIDMNIWLDFSHQPRLIPSSHCGACLAGAVMLKTLEIEAPFQSSYQPHHFPDNESQLNALEFFRCNHPQTAFTKLGIAEFPPFNLPTVPEYGYGHDAFMDALLVLADHLEAFGF